MAFIVFEGLDASGKSTQLLKLEDYLKSKNLEVISTREPGGTNLSEELREILIRNDGEAPTSRAEILIYEAARAQHVEKIIRPNLSKGKWVLCDRFTASSIAFQSGGRNLKEKDIVWLNNFAVDSVMPDLTIYIDIDVKESEKRKAQRAFELNQEQDRFEQEKNEFHQRIRDSYLKQAEESGDWLCVNGCQTVEEIFSEIVVAIDGHQWIK